MKNALFVLFALASLCASGQETDYCSEISSTKDKFSGSIRHESPLFEPIYFSRVTEGGITVYFLRLSIDGGTLSIYDGVTILLKNGDKIYRPKEIVSVDATNKGYNYSAFLVLSPADISKLKTSYITDFKIGLHSLEDIDGMKYMEYLRCITKIK